MKNGFIFEAFDFLIRKILFRLNLVEIFKLVAIRAVKGGNQADTYAAANVAIDIYQIFKWLVLVLFWCMSSKSTVELYIISYFLATNTFTYFFYEVWGSNHKRQDNQESRNRRFLNTCLSISYHFLCYAYLYQIHFYTQITWPDNIIDTFNAVYLSVTTGLTLTYSGFSPNTQFIRMVFLSELINTFIFITIIITNTIPSQKVIRR